MVAASSLVYDSVQKLFGQIACCKSGRGAQVKVLFPNKRKHDRSSTGQNYRQCSFLDKHELVFQVLRQGVREKWHRLIKGRTNTSFVEED